MTPSFDMQGLHHKNTKLGCRTSARKEKCEARMVHAQAHWNCEAEDGKHPSLMNLHQTRIWLVASEFGTNYSNPWIQPLCVHTAGCRCVQCFLRDFGPLNSSIFDHVYLSVAKVYHYKTNTISNFFQECDNDFSRFRLSSDLNLVHLWNVVDQQICSLDVQLTNL